MKNDFFIENGVLRRYHGLSGCVVIPDDVKIIGADSFLFCETLTALIIGDGVKEIEEAAFLGCRNLTSIRIGSGVVSIGRSAFEGCRSLKNLTLPKSIQHLDLKIFGNSESDVPKGIAIDAPSCLIAATESNELKLSLMRSFLYHPDESVLPDRLAYAFRYRRKVLPLIFQHDAAHILAHYAEAKKITNFEKDFLFPAQAKNATACIAFLLQWKHSHMPENSFVQSLQHGLKE